MTIGTVLLGGFGALLLIAGFVGTCLILAGNGCDVDLD